MKSAVCKVLLYTYLLSALGFFLPVVAFSQQKLTIEDIWSKYAFAGESVEGFTSMKDGEHYSAISSNKNGENNFLIYSFATGKVTDTIALGKYLIPADSTHAIIPSDYKMSEDETKVLFETAKEKIYRRSSRSNFFVYNLKTKKINALSGGGKQQNADFSPDGNKIAFVRNNNLFYKELLSGNEIQVTADGGKNLIINGITDWVYEEEFEFVKAFEWSPDGRYLAYYRFDESEVPEYTVQFFKGLYPENYTYKYPKVGEKNAVVSCFSH